MREYQEEYLRLLAKSARKAGPTGVSRTAEEYVAAAMEADRASTKAVERGTVLLRENLFPVLDDILAASDGELENLYEFAVRLMGSSGRDLGLNYRIHLALMDFARHTGRTDMLLRELYHVGMSLYYLESMLSPGRVRMYSTRMRMYFTECASYFGTPYYDECDAETRGYIHRSLGNIALTYDDSDAASINAKLAAVTRSIQILSDPDVRAKTPELPWDMFLYKSHQERTSLLSALRSGNAGPDAYAQVLESAQTVQSRQLAAFREKGIPPEPRWQYAYMAARYHCGAMLLPELLDGLYALSTSRPQDDFSAQGMFAYVSAPAYYLGYAQKLPDGGNTGTALRVNRMTKRMRRYIYALPAGENSDMLLFNLRQFLSVYDEEAGGIDFFEILQDVFASRNPTGYIRMWLTGRIAAALTAWAVEDCPEKLVGLCGAGCVEDVKARREELCGWASTAGRLTDIGMIHFLRLESSACRGLFEEEDALLRLHTHLGAKLLSAHASTAEFADVVLGHHRSFDEKSGHPMDFTFRGKTSRNMIFLVSAADTLASSDLDTATRSRPHITFDAAVAHIIAGSGTVYAPFAASLLRTPARLDYLARSIPDWKREALFSIYRRASEA